MKKIMNRGLLFGVAVGLTTAAFGSDISKPPTKKPSASGQVFEHIKKITQSAVSVAADYKQVSKLGDALKIIQAADKEGIMTDKKLLESARVMLVDALPLLQHSLETLTELTALTNTINKEFLTKVSIFGSLSDPKSPAAIINRVSLQLQYAMLVFGGVIKTINKVDLNKLFEEQTKKKEEAKIETADIEKKIQEITQERTEEEFPEPPTYEAPQPPAFQEVE